jgi:hypothetical protein
MPLRLRLVNLNKEHSVPEHVAFESKEVGLADGLAQEFVAFALSAGVLKFGDFKTKAGRQSPYFFKAGSNST